MEVSPDPHASADATGIAEELRISRKRYRYFVEQTAEGFYRLESEEPIPSSAPASEQVDLMYRSMVVAECNDFFARMYGFADQSEVIGRRLVELHRGPDREANRNALRTFVEEGYRVIDVPTEEAGPSGTTIHLLNNAVGILEEGMLLGIWGTQRDVSEAKRAEKRQRDLDERIRETQRLESLGVLASGIAHDFNNILTSILGAASLAELELGEDSRALPMIQLIQTSSERAAKLCKQLQSYSGGCSPELHPVDLEELVRESVALLSVSISKKIDMRCELSPVPLVSGDANQLQQVLLNIVINASEAIGDEVGVVTVRTWRTEAEVVALSVTDDGCGMSPEVLEKAFDPFFSTKGLRKGRGLGLSSVQGIVTSHRGTISVDTEPGRGTTFTLELPASKLPATSGTRADPLGAWQPGRVLVVDDEEGIRNLTKRCLERFEFEVLTAADGHEGLELFLSRRDEIDMALIDVSMPTMSGAELLREIRAIRPSLPVVLSSGHDQDLVRSQVRENANTAFLEKPYLVVELLDKIRSVQTRS